MIRLPQTEGRAQNLDLLSIYTDPFILYGYAASIPFFIALYLAFRLLSRISANKAFSKESVKNVRGIQRCAIALCILILPAGIYIRLFHHRDDDPAGFLALSMLFAFASLVIASAAGVFKAILQDGTDRLNKQPTEQKS